MKMKKSLTILSFALLALTFESCEKCATCTTFEEDPNATTTERVAEICGRGRDFTDQVTVYERTNWECVEN